MRLIAWLAAPAVFLGAFYAWPLAHTLAEAGADGWRWVVSPYVRGRLGIALLQAVLSVLLTLALAAPLAWLHHRYALRGGRLAMALHAAPFVMPVFVVVYGIQLTLGAWLPPLAAVVVAHAYYNYGFAARILAAALDRRPRRLEAAAGTLGATPVGAFARVSLPLLLPSFLSVGLLVFLFSFASFGTVLFLGEGRVATPETMIYAQLGGAFPRTERAAALGALQIALSVALFVAYQALAARTRGLERAPDAQRAPAPWGARIAAVAAVGLAAAPLAAVLAGGFRVRGVWTLEPWRALLDPSHPAHVAGFDLGRALSASAVYAGASAALALVLVGILAYALPALGPRARASAEALAALPLGTSSLLLGLGFLLAFGAGAFVDLRGSRLAIVALHTLVALPLAARVVLPAFALRDRRLDEAASLLGAGPAQVALRIHLPLLAAPIAAGAAIAAAASLGDFGGGVLLMRPDNMSLAVWIGRHDVAFDPLAKAQAIALTGFLGLLAGGAFALAGRRLAP